MNSFKTAVNQARKESWSIIEKAYQEIQARDNKLIEYLLLHLIKTIPHSKIKLGERWVNNESKKDKRYLEVDKGFTVFLSIEDDMYKYCKQEDSIEVLKAEDKIYISAHIINTASMCCDAIKISDLTLEALTDKIKEMIEHLKGQNVK